MDRLLENTVERLVERADVVGSATGLHKLQLSPERDIPCAEDILPATRAGAEVVRVIGSRKEVARDALAAAGRIGDQELAGAPRIGDRQRAAGDRTGRGLDYERVPVVVVENESLGPEVTLLGGKGEGGGQEKSENGDED